MSTAFQITIAEGFNLLWKYSLKNKPSARTWSPNRDAIVRSSGAFLLDFATEMDVEAHIQIRRNEGKSNQTIRHDIQVWTLLYNEARRWKRKKYILDGIHCEHFKLPEENPMLDIKRPKAQPRTRIVTPNEMAVWCEHAPERLRRITVFQLDTGLTEVDLRRLKVKEYNPYSDSIDGYRNKTGVEGPIPVTNRVRSIIMERKNQGQEYVLDFTNYINDVRVTKKKAKATWQMRDLRKTLINEVFDIAKGDIRPAQQIARHKTAKTTWDWYIVNKNRQLKPHIEELEKRYPVIT